MGEFITRIRLSGSPEEIGLQHGEKLAEQINHNIEFYKPIFLANLGTEAKVLQETVRIKERIRAFNPNYIREIDHIALGAKVSEPLWVYALNARTELTLTQQYDECTAVVFPRQKILGQTWDWAQALEDNFVIMEICQPSGHKIFQLTEAGIIGKIGLNNYGLGVTLNILWVKDQLLSGIPIHILLRTVLESQTLEGARYTINRSLNGKASNIIVSHAGRAFDVEFFGDETIFYDIEEHAYSHTNHYIHSKKSLCIDETDRTNSIARHKKALEEFSKLEHFSTQEMISILSDNSCGESSIMASFKPAAQIEMGYSGTLATIVMDLENKSMKVRKGNPSSRFLNLNSFEDFIIE